MLLPFGIPQEEVLYHHRRVGQVQRVHLLDGIDRRVFPHFVGNTQRLQSLENNAPLFAHVEGWQWRPDMIWFDNLNSVRTTSYYVQQLYAQNKGTNVLPLTMNKKNVTGAEGQNGLFASAVYDKDKNELIVKVANTSATAQPISLNFEGLKKQDVLSNGRCIKLRSLDLDKDNTLEQPFAIVPQETPVSIEGNVFTTELEPTTFAVYKFTKK